MWLFNGWRLFGKSLNGKAGRRGRARRKRGPGRPTERMSQQQARCCLIEILEERLLLSATASPTFVIQSHSSAGIAPNTSGGVAPIDPAQMRAAYGVSQISFNGTAGTGAGQTIAIVDAYNDPNIISDASSFSSRFGLQQFNVSGGPTFKVLNENGGTSLPSNSSPGGWDVEEALDVEWAHSIAPEANIILFEAASNSYSDLMAAVATAADYSGVSAVSMSWGGGEFSSETSFDSSFLTPSGHQGVTFLASTGDDGTPAGYPALSPNVVAVGGTSLDIDSSGDYLGESAWSDGGGGISAYESQPSYQTGKVNGTSSTMRTVPDVAMDADPNTGVYVLDSFDGGYLQVGGTSLSSPMWAGLIAIANQGRALDGESSLNGLTQTLPTLYSLPSSDFHDITTGSNGTYSATVGYDLTTGLGTPIANLLVPALAGYSATQPPSVSGPSAISVNENSTLLFSTAQNDIISLADAQAGSNADSLTLSVADGTLALGSTSGVTVTAGANDSSSMTVSGTLANLNAALNGLVYTPNSVYSGSDSLHLSLTDPGDSLTGSATVAITVNAPAPPSVTAPTAISVNENSTLLFSTATGDGITVADAAAGSNADTLTLTATDGTLALGSTSGVTVTAGANDSSSMTVSGTLANLNAALNRLVYTPNVGYSGSDSLHLSLTDPGDGITGLATVAITVNAPSPPSVTAPAARSMNVNSSTVFSTAQGTAITFADSFAGSSPETLTLTATDGTLTLASTNGLSFTAGSNGSPSLTVTGTLANLNAAVNGLTYTPGSGYSGSDSLHISLTDPGDSLTGSASVGLTVNGGPSVTAPSAVSVKKNGTFTFSSGNAISVVDAAAGSNAEQLTLHASHGTLKLASTSGLTIVSGSNKSASMTVSGTLVNLNRDLAGLVYTPTSGYSGSDSLTVSVTDKGDGLTSPTATVAVTVGGAPTITSAKTAAFTVGTAGTFTVKTTGFPAPTMAVSTALPSGITFNTSTGVLSGSPNAGSGGTYHFTITASNGFGTQASQSFTLTVNQKPTVNAPATPSINENTAMVFSAANGNAFTVADANAGSTADRLTLTAAHGTIKLASTSGLHVVSGANKSSSMTVGGTLANLNAALNGLTFTPAAGYVGAALINVSIENMTNGLTGSAAVALTVNAVSQSHSGPMTAQFGQDSGTAGFDVNWAGLLAAVEELYT
jgi:hypothetical protein